MINRETNCIQKAILGGLYANAWVRYLHGHNMLQPFDLIIMYIGLALQCFWDIPMYLIGEVWRSVNLCIMG